MKLKVIGADYGLTWENCRGVLAQKAQKMGWALCIGAGSSRGTTNGVFPEWSELVDRLIQEDKEATKADALAKSLKHDFNADALIQAAKDRLKLSDDQFIRKLEELLYEDLKNKAGEEWTNIAKGLTAVSPAELPTHHWEAFVQFFAASYPDLSALQLARVVSKTAGTDREPAAVISFNAEPLFYALVNGVRGLSSSENKPSKTLRMFNRVTRGISYQEAARIPYIFCHGLLNIEGGFKRFAASASAEKLVFSEAAYLQLANNAFSWQAALFIGAAVLRSIVFVGLSFSDPNVRRWLAWIHANRVHELRLRGRDERSYEHYWIKTDPHNESRKRWLESLVRHLGVRLVWIDGWNRLEEHLSRMLSFDE